MKTTTRIHASPVSDKNGQRPDTPAGFPARLASRWLDGLIAERGLSRNTVAAYRQDLDALRDFLDELETPLSGLDDENITLFIAWLRKRGDATRTLARRISSLRSFLAWCVERGELASNPAALIDTPKLPSLLPDVLTQDEIVRLLNAPDATSKLGLRDRAMLELLYAAGMRVSELIELQPIDLDLQRGVVRIFGKGSKERLVPLHDAAVMRMAEYLKIVRPLFTPVEDRVFLNRSGNGRLEAGQTLRAGGGHPKTHFPAHVPALLRHPPAGRRGGSPFRADPPRPCGHERHGALYARPVRTPAPDPQEIPSPVPARRARPG